MNRRILLAGGLVSSILYVAIDLVATRRYSGYSYANQTVSELFARDAPTRGLMVALNGIPYGLLMTAFALGVAHEGRPAKAARVTAALLIGYAVAGAAGGLAFNMDRREVISAGEQVTRGELHAPATIVMSLCLIGAMVAGARLGGNRFRVYTYATIATLLTFGMLAGLQTGAMTRNDPTPWMGLEERVNIYATMIWIAVLAVALIRQEQSVEQQGHPVLPPHAAGA